MRKLCRICAVLLVLGFIHGSAPGTQTAPVNATLPGISGTPTVGQVLSASTGSWMGCGACSYAYQWQREGSAIGGATASSYTLVGADLGALLTVSVTASNALGTSAPAISALAGPTLATTVRYVSSSSGNDTWNGTAPAFVSGTTGPWATLAKVNSTVPAGPASVLFKRGDKWDKSAGPSVSGQLSPSSCGTSGSPVVFGAYGTGANPIIDGSADASQTSAWQATGTPNVWQSTQTFYPATSTTVTVTAGTPGVIHWPTNGPINGSSVVFGGTPPTGITAGQIYYVVNASGNVDFNIALTFNGTPLAISGAGSAIAGANGLPYINANDIGNVLWGFAPLGGSTPAAVVTASAGVMKGAGAGGIWYKPGDGTANIGTTTGNWNFNTDNFRVQIYVAGGVNPATALPGLRLAMDESPIYVLNQSYCTFQNFTIQNSAQAAVYFFGGLQMNGLVLRDSVVQWIGGANNGGQSGIGTRLGDGVDIAGAFDTILIERNFFYQMYDGSVAPQSGGTPHNNLTVRNNVAVNYTTGMGFLNSTGSGTNIQNGLFLYNNTINSTTSWSRVPTLQRPNGDSQRVSLNTSYDGFVTVINQDFRNNVFAGSSAFGNNDAFGNSTYTCPGTPLTCTLTGASWNNFDYDNWATVSGNPVGYVGAGNPDLATWFSNHGFETHGLVNVAPQFMNTTNDFRPAAGSPLRNAGANLYALGVVWDINHKPRPSTGAFTLGAYQ